MLVALAAALSFWALGHDARTVHADIANGSTLSPLRRLLVPAEGVGLVNPRMFVAAAKAMPPDATYYVATGPGVPGATARSLGWVRPFASYWLLPRRRTDEIDEATWIFSYGADLSSVGPRYRRVVRLGPGVALGEVRR
jgi:hypothetical protein